MMVLAVPASRGQPLPETLAGVPLPRYADRVRKLIDGHITNHRVTRVARTYDARENAYDANKFDEVKGVAFHGSDRWVSLPVSTDGSEAYAYYVDRDCCYGFKRKGAGRFEVHSFKTEWMEPNTYTSSFLRFAAARQVFVPDRPIKLDSVSDVDFEGRSAVRLEYIDDKRGKEVVHLDRTTLQFLQQESEKSYDLTSNRHVPIKQVVRTEYRDAGGGKWLPTRWEAYRVMPKHPKMLLFSVDITEYVPHTPAADELDIEKRFGVKPIAYEPRPADRPVGGAPARRSWPLYAAAAALLVAAVGLALVVARRRRAQA